MNHQTRLPFQIAFLTGQSRPPSTALSPAQAEFLAALPAPVESKATRNFPYPVHDPAGSPFAAAPLLMASLRNTWQYAASRCSPFAAHHRPMVEEFLARADRTLLLVGSCGLELLNNLALPADTLRRVTIFAYGPVARWRPDCACLLVQGRRDWLSRQYFRTVDARVNAGHMDYLASPEVITLAVETVRWFATLTTP